MNLKPEINIEPLLIFLFTIDKRTNTVIKLINRVSSFKIFLINFYRERGMERERNINRRAKHQWVCSPSGDQA